jgi:metallo-beta-lactamase class B
MRREKTMKIGKLISALMISALAFPAVAAESPQSAAEAAAATKIAGADAKDMPLFLCKPHAAFVIRNALENGSKIRVAPTKLFDNLYAISSEFVGVLVFQTSAGLILFDGGQSEAEARDFVEPGLVKLGLDPSQVKYVIGTHGHVDHFGGAEYWQRTYGAKVALSKADWTIFTKPAAGSKLPNKDFEIVDGQKLTLGGDTLTFTVTPGHTLGAVSTILPAREGGKLYPISLLGMAALPANLQPDSSASGLLAYDQAILRFKQISADAHAVGYYNTHVFAADVLPRLAAVRARKPGAPNPFVVGPAYVGRYYDIVHHCTVGAESRSAEDNAWNIPIPPGTVIGE